MVSHDKIPNIYTPKLIGLSNEGYRISAPEGF